MEVEARGRRKLGIAIKDTKVVVETSLEGLAPSHYTTIYREVILRVVAIGDATYYAIGISTRRKATRMVEAYAEIAHTRILREIVKCKVRG